MSYLLSFVGILGIVASVISHKWFVGTEGLWVWWVILILSLELIIPVIGIIIVRIYLTVKRR